MMKLLFRYLIIFTLITFAGFAKSTAAIKVPPHVSVSEQQFKGLRKAYLKKSAVIDELLTSAGLAPNSPKYLNGLVTEASPYLLRHAVNPINWQAWNEAVFETAKREKS
ncbi:hypothetical protein AN214_01385 [Pseudoalteromonas sp. P1-9]|nr:hypothetical protein AN214_01385 [Pseudoalteromonas sp. P1-9]